MNSVTYKFHHTLAAQAEAQAHLIDDPGSNPELIDSVENSSLSIEEKILL